jgi:polysaccharide export outer membrane protein
VRPRDDSTEGYIQELIELKIGTLIIVATALLCAAGCGGGNGGARGWKKIPQREHPFDTSQGIPVDREYRLAVGDELLLNVAFHDGLTTHAVVRPDGKITFPVVGEVAAAGLTPSELDAIVTERMAEYVINPDAVIVVQKYSEQLIYVLGEVVVPGAYAVRRGMTVSQAITAARGPTTIAKLTDVVLIRRETPYKATGVKLDIEHFFEDGNYEADAYVRAYDIVYIPRTKVGTVSVFLEQIFRSWTYPLNVIVRGYDMIIND